MPVERLEHFGTPCRLPENETPQERQLRLEQEARAEQIREDWREDDRLFEGE